VREADNLPPYSADVKKSRSLNSPRLLWACMTCNGCALPFIQIRNITHITILVYASIFFYGIRSALEETGLILSYQQYFAKIKNFEFFIYVLQFFSLIFSRAVIHLNLQYFHLHCVRTGVHSVTSLRNERPYF
jgi:hypothetical protein